MRTDGRKFDELREIRISPEYIRNAEGSVKIEMGHTTLICTASVEENIPRWLVGEGRGWVTAEYGMLPRSTHSRIRREKALSGGRTQEISRLIGRSLRAAVDLQALGERQITVDCDVIQADGGTRTAAVTGGFVALGLALKFLHQQGLLTTNPLTHYVAATSVGWDGQSPLLDLNYDEDSAIAVDMNFVMDHQFNFVEIQGTAEGHSFSFDDLQKMIEVAREGCRQLFAAQEAILKDFFPLPENNK